MTDTQLVPTVGMFTLDHQARTLRGRLLPYGVQSVGRSSSNTAPITFPRGNVRVPRDPLVVSLNDEHARHNVIGRAVELVEDDAGVLAVFTIADDDLADQWLAEHEATTVYLSAEVADLVRLPGDLGTGRLAGASVTSTPAFEGTLATFSLIGEETPAAAAPAAVLEQAEPAQPEEAAVTTAQTMLASRRPSTQAQPNDERPQLTRAGFFSAFTHARQTGDHSALAPYLATAVGADGAGLFALSNVKYDGAGGWVTDALMPTSWIGELWSGRRFQRRIVPLLTQKPLTSMKASGWRWLVRPAMGPWAGNKSPIPSNAPTVGPADFPAVRFSGGHDLAIEYFHFGQTDVIESYADAMVDSYAMLSDAYALTQLTAGATPYTPDPANTVNTGLLDIVDGALAVVAAGGQPGWAIVAPDVFKGVIATPREDSLAYLSATVNLEGGAVDQAPFQIIPDARLAAGGIIVGDKGGATAWELPGVPIRVSAPDLQLGGVDEAFFGYIGVGVTTPAVVVKNAAAGLVAGVEDAVLVAAEKSRK